MRRSGRAKRYDWHRGGQHALVSRLGNALAVDYALGQVIFQLSASKGEDAFLTFLDHLTQQLSADEAVVVVLDNVGYPKSHALRECWRQYGDRLQPFFLPAYSPHLNRIERLGHSRALSQRHTCLSPLVE